MYGGGLILASWAGYSNPNQGMKFAKYKEIFEDMLNGQSEKALYKILEYKEKNYD